VAAGEVLTAVRLSLVEVPSLGEEGSGLLRDSRRFHRRSTPRRTLERREACLVLLSLLVMAYYGICVLNGGPDTGRRGMKGLRMVPLEGAARCFSPGVLHTCLCFCATSVLAILVVLPLVQRSCQPRRPLPHQD